MNIPSPILQFIRNKTIAGSMLLPFHYPEVEEWEGYQSAFRYHGLTGEDLTGTAHGQWQPGWYVIALNGLDDPFFIDINEAESGFPVYYEQHDAGIWDPITIAPDIASFEALLFALRSLDSSQTSATFIQAMQEFGNTPRNIFWQEVCDEFNKESKEIQDNNISPDRTLWTPGQLVLIEAGPDKIKVVNYLRKIWDISPQEALARMAQQEVIVAEGYQAHLQKYKNGLLKLGAMATFQFQTTEDKPEPITIKGQQGYVVSLLSLLDQLPEDCIIRKYQANRYTTEKALYFEQDIILDTLDLDNPFGRVPADWQERYNSAIDENNWKKQQQLWNEHNSQHIYLLFVKGTLTVNRHITNNDTDGATGLIVLGDLRCSNIIVGGQEIYVQQNLEVDGLYWGDYNHGQLTVKGDLRAQVLLQTDYSIIVQGRQYTARHITDEHFEFSGILDDVFYEEVLTESAGPLTERLSKSLVQERLQQGQPVIKPTLNLKPGIWDENC